MHLKAADGFLMIAALAILWSLYRAHKDQNGLSAFNLFDLLMDNGRISRIASVFMGGFLLVSWIMIRLTLDGKMTEGYMGLYFAGIIAPIISKLFSPPAAPGTTQVIENRTVTKTVDGAPAT